MVVENEISSFGEWLLGTETQRGALLQFSYTFGALALLALVVGFLVLLVRYGPMRAGELTYRTISSGFAELLRVSPRRIMALAMLTIKESWRRRVWIGMVVFVLILLFASWFLTSDHREPGKLYVSFVLTSTTFLVLLLSLVLSAFSLPADFESKTIYTIVTKPVRAGDIVLGKMIGFTIVGTVMLALMGVCSYIFVLGSLNHTHQVLRDSSEGAVEFRSPDGELLGTRGVTSNHRRHFHEYEAGPEGDGQADSYHGHDHLILAGEDVTSGAQHILRARTPKRGTIRWLDPNGVTKDRGVSVGNEWTYRSFIQGGTQAAAIWTFDGVDKSLLNENGDLTIELFVDVFRTYAGDHERSIEGSIQLRNPESGLRNSIATFGAKDSQIDTFTFPRAQFDSDMNSIDLLDDLVSEEGQIEVIVQSLERAQYYGFNQADCYIRLEEDSPAWNFTKGYLGIWVQMVIVISIGVTASTFLNGPIALSFTASFILLGFLRAKMIGIATGFEPDGTKVYGGGPLESLVRIFTQMNLTAKFQDEEKNVPVQVMKTLDKEVLQKGMEAMAYVLPDFRTLSSVRYVAEGFSIPPAMIGRELAIGLAYLIGLSIAGYFFLRTREVAK